MSWQQLLDRRERHNTKVLELEATLVYLNIVLVKCEGVLKEAKMELRLLDSEIQAKAQEVEL